jgi:POT family proton-dependent oligopeptide transporter
LVLDTTEKSFLGHPRGLFLLFFVEMWERFSYYGMRALLIFYLTKHWLFSDGKSNLIYGAYTSLVYITPAIGGYVADRYLGQRKAVVFGAVLLSFGHILMGFEGNNATAGLALNVFWLALAFIIVGSGFLKANVSVIVGQLYDRTDIRRDSAYTIFYVGINMGGALGPLIAGYLGETYGWSYGFGAAGLCMVLGLLTFVLGKPLLRGCGEAPDPARLVRPLAGLTLERWIYVFGVAAVGGIWLLIQYQSVVGYLLGIAGAFLLGYVVWIAVTTLTPHERDRIFAAIFLMLGVVLFLALFEQAGSSLNLYTDRYVDRMGVPASLFQSVNSLFIILFGPILAIIWVWMGKKGWDPSAPAKFGMSLLQLGLSFLLLVWGARAAGSALTPVSFIILFYFLQTTGELFLQPVGLSAMNRLAPVQMASLIMGSWFLANAFGEYGASLIAYATGGSGAGGTALGKAGYLSVYTTGGWAAIGAGVLVLVVSPFIKKLMHLDTLTDA